MAGSLDDNPPNLYGDQAIDYDFLVLGRDGGAKVYVAKGKMLDPGDIAGELRKIADHIDPPDGHPGICDCDDPLPESWLR